LKLESFQPARAGEKLKETMARHRIAQQRQILTQTGWPETPESAAGSDWNEWADQIGIPGRMNPGMRMGENGDEKVGHGSGGMSPLRAAQ
jgi:hypothetical protein